MTLNMKLFVKSGVNKMPFDYDGPGDFGTCSTCGEDYSNQYEADEFFCRICEARANGDICLVCTNAVYRDEVLCKKCLNETEFNSPEDMEYTTKFEELLEDIKALKTELVEKVKEEYESSPVPIPNQPVERTPSSILSLGRANGMGTAIDALSKIIKEYEEEA